MKKTDTPAISGQVLVADFQSAYVGLATAELAKSEAHRSEEAIVSELQSLSSQSYLNPNGISPVRQNDIGRASVNAHVMKVQAEQLQQMSYQQLAVLQDELSNNYIGKKVLVTPFESSESPFDTVWLNKETGYRTNQNTKKQIKGTIAEIWLDKNLLVIKPPLLPRMINSELNAYFVYVIDPVTAQPAVEVTIL